MKHRCKPSDRALVILVVSVVLLKYYSCLAESLLHVAGSTSQIFTKLIIYLPHLFAVVCCLSIWFNHPYNTCVPLVKVPVVEFFTHNQVMCIIPGFYGRNVEALFCALETRSSAVQMNCVYAIL
jgi:hypothetical protein